MDSKMLKVDSGFIGRSKLLWLVLFLSLISSMILGFLSPERIRYLNYEPISCDVIERGLKYEIDYPCSDYKYEGYPVMSFRVDDSKKQHETLRVLANFLNPNQTHDHNIEVKIQVTIVGFNLLSHTVIQKKNKHEFHVFCVKDSTYCERFDLLNKALSGFDYYYVFIDITNIEHINHHEYRGFRINIIQDNEDFGLFIKRTKTFLLISSLIAFVLIKILKFKFSGNKILMPLGVSFIFLVDPIYYFRTDEPGSAIAFTSILIKLSFVSIMIHHWASEIIKIERNSSQKKCLSFLSKLVAIVLFVLGASAYYIINKSEKEDPIFYYDTWFASKDKNFSNIKSIYLNATYIWLGILVSYICRKIYLSKTVYPEEKGKCLIILFFIIMWVPLIKSGCFETFPLKAGKDFVAMGLAATYTGLQFFLHTPDATKAYEQVHQYELEQ